MFSKVVEMTMPGGFEALKLAGFASRNRISLAILRLTRNRTRRAKWSPQALQRFPETCRSALWLFLLCACSFPFPVFAQDALPDGGLSVALAIEQATISAIEKAEHSVVAISRVRRNVGPADQPLKFSLTESPSDPDFVPTLFGSGVVISDDGYIVTCAHVLDDPRNHDYFVWLDKESYAARVIGHPAKVLAADPFSDLAILKIDATNLTSMPFGKSESLRKGQFVIALGNPQAIARDGEASASWGIISNLQRVAPAESDARTGVRETIHQLGMLIQTDAKLTLGTSGGALINLRGEMIGLTTSLAATSGYEQSAGFAIAVDGMFLRAIETLKLGRLPNYGFLGIQPEDVSAADRSRGISGARVIDVIQGLPGEHAGLQKKDVIVEVGDEPIRDRQDLFRELSRGAAGDIITLRVLRFHSSGSSPETLILKAELSKKYIATTRPGYAINSPLSWRGMDVEYATAIPTEISRGDTFAGKRGAKLAVLSVAPDTKAWKAGIRPGYGIQAVAGKAVLTPDEFYQAMADRLGAVELSVTQLDGRIQKLIVEAE